MMQWKPIETAPRDGTLVLLSDGEYRELGWWRASVNHYVWRDIMWHVLSPPPTHWAAIPDVPKE